jgi:spoIIIJ-associated protein
MNNEYKIPDITVSGNTYEEAYAEAMSQLGVPEDALEVDTLSQAHDDTLPGAEPLPGVTLRFRVKQDVLLAHAKRHLKQMLELVGVPGKVEAMMRRRGLTLNIIAGEDGALVIGRNGQNLEALQYLVNRMTVKGGRELAPIIVDSEGYREKHYSRLEDLARRTTKKVMRFQREIALEPMPAGDRKIIHLALREVRGVHTISRGEDAERHVVITPVEGEPPPRGVIRGRVSQPQREGRGNFDRGGREHGGREGGGREGGGREGGQGRGRRRGKGRGRQGGPRNDQRPPRRETQAGQPPPPPPPEPPKSEFE